MLDHNNINKNNKELSMVVKQKMFQELANNTQTYIDLLAEHLSQYCNCTISVCIKIIKFDDTTQNKATTLNRSSNTKKDRLKDDEDININKNDDFKFLCDGKNTFWGKANLIKEYKEGNYEVEEKMSIWSNKYISTLIAPIRYFSKHSKHNNINMNFDILGFLCIDSKKVMNDWENIDSYELNILAIFADSIYTYLKKCKDIYCNDMEE